MVSDPNADAVVIEGSRIAAVGPEEEVAATRPEGEERVDLQGRALLPGFIDAHLHLFHIGLTELGWRVDLADRSRNDVLGTLADAVRDRGAGEWVIGGGWDESAWPEKTYLTREELDRVSERSPIFAVRMDGHLLIANTAGLRHAQEIVAPQWASSLIDAKTGEIREEAVWELLETIEPDESTLRDAVAAAARHCHRRGVTSVHAMSLRWIPPLLERRGQDRLRVNVYQKAQTPSDVDAMVPAEHFDGEWIRFGGVKVFADGSLGARNAAVKKPYVGGGTGSLNHSDDSIRGILARSEERGWQTAIHAIGDRAIEQVLDAHAAVGTSADRRHRIEHFELASPEQIERARDLGIHASMQPNFLGNWSGPGSMNESRLGRERDEVSNAFRRVLDLGASLALGSDGMPVSPLYGIESAVNTPYSAQRLTVDEALAGYTQGGATLSFEEDVKGRLEPGAYADLVVLDADPRVAPERIGERRVEQVYVGGACVYRL